MTIENLLYLSKLPHQVGGKDSIWERALQLYNDNHEEKLKLRCHSHYRTVSVFVMNHFHFDPSYYKPGPSGLSEAAKDELRSIIREEIDRRVTVSVRDIKLPEDSIRFR